MRISEARKQVVGIIRDLHHGDLDAMSVVWLLAEMFPKELVTVVAALRFTDSLSKKEIKYREYDMDPNWKLLRKKPQHPRTATEVWNSHAERQAEWLGITEQLKRHAAKQQQEAIMKHIEESLKNKPLIAPEEKIS